MAIKITPDKLTSYLGYGIGAAQAAQVALEQIPAGTSMHKGDYIQLGIALLMAVFGWATNKQQLGKQVTPQE